MSVARLDVARALVSQSNWVRLCLPRPCGLYGPNKIMLYCYKRYRVQHLIFRNSYRYIWHSLDWFFCTQSLVICRCESLRWQKNVSILPWFVIRKVILTVDSLTEYICRWIKGNSLRWMQLLLIRPSKREASTTGLAKKNFLGCSSSLLWSRFENRNTRGIQHFRPAS